MQIALVVFGVVFCFLIVGIIFIAVFSSYKKKNIRCSAQTQGQLIQIKMGANKRFYYIYSYYANGAEHQLKTFEKTKMTNRVGDPAEIWYNPEKPEEAQVIHHSDKFYNIMIIIGVVMLLLGLLPFCIGIIASQLQFKGG